MTTDQNNRWRVHKQAIRTATPVFVPVSHENSSCSPLRTTSEPHNWQQTLLISPHAKRASLESGLKSYFAPISYIGTYSKTPNSLPDAASRCTSTDGHSGWTPEFMGLSAEPARHCRRSRHAHLVQRYRRSAQVRGGIHRWCKRVQLRWLPQNWLHQLQLSTLILHVINQLLQRTWLNCPFCRDNTQLTPSEESARITSS